MESWVVIETKKAFIEQIVLYDDYKTKSVKKVTTQEKKKEAQKPLNNFAAVTLSSTKKKKKPIQI